MSYFTPDEKTRLSFHPKGGTGASSLGVDNLPAFLAAGNLKSLISEDLLRSTRAIEFRLPTGGKAFGYPFPPGDAPIGYMEVSRTQLSIARHYGGITIQGHHYTYFPAHDELWRDDVLAMVEGWRKEATKQVPEQPPQVQWELL